MSQKTEKKASKPPAKQAAKKGGKSKKGRSSEMLLPGYLQAMLSAAQLVVLLVAGLVCVLSYTAGGSLVTVALRTGAAILSTGAVMWLICWLVIRNSIDTIAELKQIALKQAASQVESSVEKQV